MEREEWDERYAGEELLWHADPNRFLVTETADLTPGTVLDVACGEGRNAVWLAAKGWRATGVDFSAVALAKARRLAQERGVHVDWVEADVRHWRSEITFDLVIVFYLQLPPEERRDAYRSAAEAVAAGGRLLVVGHDRENLTGGIGGPKEPAVLFTADDVTDILDHVGGFTVEHAGQVRRPVATDEGTVDALDALVRAVRQ
jgi:SAM-dependent methyltransferase